MSGSEAPPAGRTSDRAEPRLAATVLVVRDAPFEVLMVRRHAKAVFASALVFPGGAIDPDDSSEDWSSLVLPVPQLSRLERAIRVAAVRETYEEASILLALSAEQAPGGSPSRLTRGDSASGGSSFRRAVAARGRLLDLGALVPFGRWITPEAEPRRFDTYFFLAVAPRGQEAASDGGETVSMEWARPIDVIERAAAGERSILFPTLMNLRRLAESRDTTGALAAARARPALTVRPRIVEGADGSRTIVIPADAGYGTTEFVLRRGGDARDA